MLCLSSRDVRVSHKVLCRHLALRKSHSFTTRSRCSFVYLVITLSADGCISHPQDVRESARSILEGLAVHDLMKERSQGLEPRSKLLLAIGVALRLRPSSCCEATSRRRFHVLQHAAFADANLPVHFSTMWLGLRYSLEQFVSYSSPESHLREASAVRHRSEPGARPKFRVEPKTVDFTGGMKHPIMHSAQQVAIARCHCL